jgi:hypothetical protein
MSDKSNSSLLPLILHEVESLTDAQQRRVLAYIRELQAGPARSGAALIELAGTIPLHDLNLMEKAIEEECERIDLDGW